MGRKIMSKRFVVKANRAVEASVSATPAKDRLWDMIDEGMADAVLEELMAYVSDDQAKEIWETITGLDFDDDNEDY